MGIFFLVCLSFLTCLLSATESPLAWQKLPDIPDQDGLAGLFSGVVSDGDARHLLVAGGANFPGKKPWEGGAKKYH